MGKLTATAIKAIKAAGRYSDGDGLFLIVGPTGARSWVCRVQKNGKRRDIGLGSEKKVSLALARERATATRAMIEMGVDPVAQRRKAAGIPTFCEATAAVYAEQHRSWKNTKHRAQWLATLETYAAPHIGDTPVNEVEGAAVRDVLMAIWLTKPETARRVRQRIGTVIDWAVAKGFREAPLSMTAVNRSLPKQKRKDTHHPSLPYAEVPQFMERLAERETVGRLALAAVILTAARSGEIRGADWSEVDTEAGLWTVPAARMKGGREHVVPLSDAACRVFERIGVLTGRRGLVFPGLVAGQPLSDMTLTKVCRAMGVAAVPHGFRSSFRDWVAEETGFDSEVAEMALAHTIENKVEAAYRRGNLLEKRRAMMAAWGEYCNGQTGGRVVRLAAVTNG